MTNSTYGIGLGNDRDDEQRRLAGAEELFDPGTFRYLDGIGIAAGARCLELGGGSGSVARFMANRVGVAGSVLVTDIDVSQLAGCDAPNVEVRVHDVCADPLDESAFDIIHARLLLEHLPDRIAVLTRLVAALRPGGWLLIEDLDFTAWQYLPRERLFCQPESVIDVYRAVVAASAALGVLSGWDSEFARDLPTHLVGAGLEDVDADRCSRLIVGGSRRSDFVTVSWRQVAPTLIENGTVSAAGMDALIAAFENPGAMSSSLEMVSAWGRRRSYS